MVGEALIDRVIHTDGRIVETPGGSPANVAIALGRLGRHPSLLTSLGRDSEGATVATWLEQSGVTVAVIPEASPTTSTATATLAADGSARYQFDLEWTMGNDHEIDAEVIHIGSISALIQPGADAVLRLAQSARTQSTITYDPNIRPALITDIEFARQRIEELVSLADIVKASDEDLNWLYPTRSLDDISAAWLNLGPSIVVVTLGARGAFAITQAGRVDCDSETVHVVDTVGAGDTFMGTLIDGLIEANLCGPRNKSELTNVRLELLKLLLRRSALAAAITVSRPGADPPRRNELEPGLPETGI
ncbi:MAG: carbohydrate kinase [Leifsonia sp.]